MIKEWTVNFDLREKIQYEQRRINKEKMRTSYKSFRDTSVMIFSIFRTGFGTKKKDDITVGQ